MLLSYPITNILTQVRTNILNFSRAIVCNCLEEQATVIIIEEKSIQEALLKAMGFRPRSFIVGYGIDFAQQYRQLPAIYALEE